MNTTTASRRVPRPCSLAVTVAATGEHGVAYVQWADGTYAVKLTTGGWADSVPAAALVFHGQAAA